jgi:hypothetical protein
MINSNEPCKQDQHQDGLNLMQKAVTIIRHVDGDAFPSPPSGKDETFSGKSFSENKPSFCENAFASLPCKRKFQGTESEKQELRKATNRRSASESRLRRKQLIEDLQKAIFDLHNEKAAMKQENDGMKLQLDASMAENRQLRFSIMLMQQQLQQFGLSERALMMQTTPMFQPAGVLDASLAAFLPFLPLLSSDWSSNAQQLLQMQLLQGHLQGLQAQLHGSNNSTRTDNVIPLVLTRNNGKAGHANYKETNTPPASPPS